MAHAKHGAADILAGYLTAAEWLRYPDHTGPAVVQKWPVYIGRLPHGPDAKVAAVAITDTSGRTQDRIMRTGEVVRHPGVQIRTRGPSYPLAFEQLQKIHYACTEDYEPSMPDVQRIRRALVVLEGIWQYRIESVVVTSGPMFMGTDTDTLLHNFSMNAVVTISLVSHPNP